MCNIGFHHKCYWMELEVCGDSLKEKAGLPTTICKIFNIFFCNLEVSSLILLRRANRVCKKARKPKPFKSEYVCNKCWIKRFVYFEILYSGWDGGLRPSLGKNKSCILLSVESTTGLLASYMPGGESVKWGIEQDWVTRQYCVRNRNCVQYKIVFFWSYLILACASYFIIGKDIHMVS